MIKRTKLLLLSEVSIKIELIWSDEIDMTKGYHGSKSAQEVLTAVEETRVIIIKRLSTHWLILTGNETKATTRSAGVYPRPSLLFGYISRYPHPPPLGFTDFELVSW